MNLKDKHSFYRNTYMKNIEIISMTTDHHSNAIKLWSECEINIEKEDQFECIKQFLSSPQSMGFVAIIDGKCIGAALCATDLRYGYIHHLAVDKAYRNNGLGKSLVNKCKEFIFSFEGLNGIAIFVWNKNHSGQRFWKSNGFEIIDGLNVLACSKESNKDGGGNT
jgi:ribosomal protein S18 acetylase RimI-like enzyme